jgi:tyrosyl-tRNA synthetase
MTGSAGLVDQRGDRVDRITGSHIDTDPVGDLDCRAEAFEAFDLVGPHAGLQPSGLQRVADVDRFGVEADRRGDRWVGQGNRHVAAGRAGDRHRRAGGHRPAGVVHEVVVGDQQVESGAGADVDVGERATFVGEGAQRRDEQRASSDLVGLCPPRRQQNDELGGVLRAELAKGVDRAELAGPRGPNERHRKVGIEAGEWRRWFGEEQPVNRCEQQHRQALRAGRGEKKAGELGILGDSSSEIGVQRGVAGLGKVGEQLLARGDGVAVARGHRRNVVDARRRSSGTVPLRMDLLADLQARGLIHDSTDLTALASRLASGPIGVYVGFDPTADSLHVGHLMGQLGLRRFQLAGHRPFPLAGGATGVVGDPGGRSEERNLLDRETLDRNLASIKPQLERLLDFESSRNAATLVDNATWTADIALLDFLRDVGKHVTVNQMMAKESVRARLDGEHGISFTEFSYMLLQANDFRYLHDEHGVELQMGGSDQWGNITAGIDLIRKTSGTTAHGLTWPLLLRSDGQKFGKSTGDAVWLAAERTSPYQFRQYWVQTDDADVAERLLRFSMRPVEEIEAIVTDHKSAPERRVAQRHLARELTELVHGPAAADAADAAAEILFGGDPTTAPEAALDVVRSEVPSTTVGADDLGDPVDLLVTTELAGSRSEARRLLDQRSTRVNGVQLDSGDDVAKLPLLHERYLLLRKGKQTYHIVEVSPGGG